MCTTHQRDMSKATHSGTRTEPVRVSADGGVTVPEVGRVWLDCPACGATAPEVTSEKRFVYYGGVPFERTVHRARLEWWRAPYTKRNGGTGWEMVPRGACSSCGALAFGRVIRMKPHGAKFEECNGACLSGRASCSCHCGGRCHGAGVCSCHKPAARAA